MWIETPLSGSRLKRLLFRKNQRLKSNEQFKSVLDKRCSVRNKHFILFAAENDCSFPRLGVSVPKSVGNAVTRNRLKRFARESFRLQQHNIPQSYDYLLIFAKQQDASSDKKSSNKTKRAKLDEVKQAFIKLAVSATEKANRTRSTDN